MITVLKLLESFGREFPLCGTPAGRELFWELNAYIAKHPTQRVFSISFAGIEVMDAVFIREGIGALAKRYLGKRYFVVVNVSSEDVRDNINYGLCAANVTLIYYKNVGEYEFLGKTSSDSINEYILSAIKESISPIDVGNTNISNNAPIINDSSDGLKKGALAESKVNALPLQYYKHRSLVDTNSGKGKELSFNPEARYVFHGQLKSYDALIDKLGYEFVRQIFANYLLLDGDDITDCVQSIYDVNKLLGIVDKPFATKFNHRQYALAYSMVFNLSKIEITNLPNDNYFEKYKIFSRVKYRQYSYLYIYENFIVSATELSKYLGEPSDWTYANLRGIENMCNVTDLINKTYVFRRGSYTIQHLAGICGLKYSDVNAVIKGISANYGDDITDAMNSLFIRLRNKSSE